MASAAKHELATGGSAEAYAPHGCWHYWAFWLSFVAGFGGSLHVAAAAAVVR